MIRRTYQSPPRRQTISNPLTWRAAQLHPPPVSRTKCFAYTLPICRWIYQVPHHEDPEGTMSVEDYRTEQTSDEDRAYGGSRFSEVRDALFANPYQRI